MEKPSENEEEILMGTIGNHAIPKKGKSVNYQTNLVSGSQDTALTDNCWAATCGCKIKAPLSEKRKQERNARTMNASECNLKVTKRKKNKMFTPCSAYKAKAFKRTEK